MLAHCNRLTFGYCAALIDTTILVNDGDIVANRVLCALAPLEANHLDGVSAR